MKTLSLTLDEIFELAKKTLLSNGCDEETATILAELIMKAERDGSLSHGLFRLPAYVSGLKSGKINGKGKPEVKKISPSVIKVLGNNCLAPVVLNKGIPELIKELSFKTYFKGVSIKPGRPTMLSKFRRKEKLFFGLPGNPISCAAGFRFFIYPLLRNSLGML